MTKSPIILCVASAMLISTLSAMQVDGPYNIWMLGRLKHTALSKLTGSKYRLFEIEVETLLMDASDSLKSDTTTIEAKEILESQLIKGIQTLALLKADEKEKANLEKEFNQALARSPKLKLIKSLARENLDS